MSSDLVPLTDESGRQLITTSPVHQTSLDLATDQGRCAVFRARGRPTTAWADLLNVPVTVHHWYAHPVQIVHDDGETVPAVRLVLFLESDRTVAFCGRGAVESWGLVLSLFGPGPWPAGLPVIIRQLETRAGRRTVSIEPQPRPPEAVAKRK